MKLKFRTLEEANDLINQLIEHHPQSIFLTDSNFKVRYFNQSFKDLAQSDKNDIINHEFCEILGCTQRDKMSAKDNGFCTHCRLRELLSGSNVSEMALVRDFLINNEVKTKHLHINSHRLVMNENKYRMVIIDDRTHKHDMN